MLKLALSLLLFAGQACGAIAFIASAQSLANGNGTTIGTPINSTGATLLIIAVMRSSAATGVSGPTDFTTACPSPGPCNTYSVAVTKTGTLSMATMYYVVNPSVTGAGHYFKFTATAGLLYVIGIAYSGALANPLDQLNSNAISGVGTTIQPGSITPLCTNELVVGVYGALVGSGVPNSSDLTLRENKNGSASNSSGYLGDSIQTAKVAINPTFNSSNVTDRVAIIASFKAATSVCPSAAIVHRIVQ